MQDYSKIKPWVVYYWETEEAIYFFGLSEIEKELIPFGMNYSRNPKFEKEEKVIDNGIKAVRNSLSAVKQYGRSALKNGDISDKFMGLLQTGKLRLPVKVVFREFPVRKISFKESLHLGIGYEEKK